MQFINFFITYWWIILLFVILIFTLLKKMAKSTVYFVGTIFLIGLFWEVFIVKGMQQASTCMVEGVHQLDEFLAQVALQKPSQARNQMICENGQTNYKIVEACLKSVAREHRLSFFVYSSLPSFKKTITEVVEFQNTKCPDQPVSYFTLD